MRDVSEFVYKNFEPVFETNEDYVVDCPFCITRVGKDDYKHHLQIAKYKETCHCFRCEYSATWIQLVMDTVGCDYVRALGILYIVPKPVLEDIPAKLFGQVVEARKVRSSEFILPDGYISINNPETQKPPLLHTARKYLKRRGFDEWYWERYQLGILGGRILIPIEGDFWQARAIFSFHEPKYMSPRDNADDVLFNSGALSLYTEVVICEGAFSAMAIGENAIALVGKNPTELKVRRLLESKVSHFIIVVESKAEESMVELADRLYSAGRRVTLMKYEDEKDPADWVQPIISTYDFKEKVSLLLSK